MKRRRLLLTVMLVWAAACKTVDPYMATGELLHTTAREVIAVGTAMNAAYDAHNVSVADYHRWSTFLNKFKPSFALATATWAFAETNKDAIAAGNVRDIITALYQELFTFMPLAVTLIQEVK